MTLINGTDLYVEATGNGEPLVFVHGSWGDHLNWEQVVPALADRYRVITYDRRGHSRSAPATGTVHDDVADLAALIEQVAGPAAHVVGNSYGSVIVLRLVASRPELVQSACVHEPAALGLLPAGTLTGPIADIATEVLELIRAGHNQDAARRFLEGVVFGPGSWEAAPARVRDTFTRNAPTYLEEGEDPDTATVDLNALAASAVPLRVTYGSSSLPAFRDIVVRIAQAVPQAAIAELPGTGHVPQLTDPELFVDSILSWLDRARTVAAEGGTR